MSCVNSVRATLSKLDNVKDVNIDFKNKTATIAMKSGELKKESVTAALKGSKFGVTSFKQAGGKKDPKKGVSKYLVTVSGMT